MICFDSELFQQNFGWQLNNDQKASIYTINALNKSSELWHTSVNRKARPVVEGEHDKSWNDHDLYCVIMEGNNFFRRNQQFRNNKWHVTELWTVEVWYWFNLKNKTVKLVYVAELWSLRSNNIYTYWFLFEKRAMHIKNTGNSLNHTWFFTLETRVKNHIIGPVFLHC